MRYIFTFFILIFGCTGTVAQQLKPHIGLSALPNDADPICQIPVYNGSFDASGLHEGDTIPDFTLYTVDGIGVNMLSVLQGQKPVLLIAGSYTCPVFRNRLVDLSAITNKYQDSIRIFVVYVVEAHPQTDPSPYSGKEWLTQQNIQDGILFRQPATYGERKALAIETMNKLTVDAAVLLDGPCNEWWERFGPAPNNAYLITPEGIVFEKQGWFNKMPDNMFTAIDSILSHPSSTDPGTNGTFQFRLDAQAGLGIPGDILTAHGTFRNRSNEGVYVMASRKEIQMIPGWETAMCTDICLAPEVDSTSFYIAPGATQEFTFYFYTSQDSNSDTAIVELTFRNMGNAQNEVIQQFWAATDLSAAINEAPNLTNSFLAYPNPVRLGEILQWDVPSDFRLYDSWGRLVYYGLAINRLRMSPQIFKPGLYFYKLSSSKEPSHMGKLVVK